MEGWIKLHRNLQDHWLWSEKPFDKKSAWIDLILSVNHKEAKIMIGNELVTIEPGSFITSEIKLMDRWGWSKTKLRNFLKLLEEDQMIIKTSDKKKTTIKLVNWGLHQVLENHEKTTEKPQKDHEKTTKKPQKDTNKNDNNNKNDKNDKINNIWSMYPKKEGKAAAIKKIPKLINEIGEEHLIRCIERYNKKIEVENISKQYIKQGSTFFNGGYVDYLDENYQDIKEGANNYGVNKYNKSDSCESTREKYNTIDWDNVGVPKPGEFIPTGEEFEYDF